MQILPIYSQNNNNQNFQAVSQKYLKRAEKEFKQIKGVSGDLLDCLTYDVFFGQIAKQDAIDTLQAIKKYASNAVEPWKSTLEYIQKL